jgi:hypothetical protein
MPIGAKIVVTLLAVSVAVGIALVDPQANNAGADWMWRGGSRDPVRRALMRPDGSLRRFTKPAILSFFGIILLALWFAVPTS